MIRDLTFRGFDGFISVNPVIYVTILFVVFFVIQVIVFTISDHYDSTQFSA